jgi:hypothetical protein
MSATHTSQSPLFGPSSERSTHVSQICLTISSMSSLLLLYLIFEIKKKCEAIVVFCVLILIVTLTWALFALFVLVFPTGNANSERGFSAIGAVHTKQRSELGHAQVIAHLMIGFNGPAVDEFTELIDVESRQPNWALYIHPNNFNN